MKTKNYLMLGILFLVTSCYKEEQVNCINKVNELSVHKELKVLRLFNDSIIQQQAKTRGWLGTLFAVYSADMVAAYAGFKVSAQAAAIITVATGGTAGSAAGVAVMASTGLIAGGASYGAYKGCTLGISAEEYAFYINKMLGQNNAIGGQIANFNLKCKETDISTEYLEEQTCELIAQLHDSIVDTALNSTEGALTRSTPELVGELDPITPEYCDNSYNILLFSDREIISLNHNVNNDLINYYQTGDYETTLNSMIAKQSVPAETGSIIKLLMDALYKGKVSDEETLDIILNRYKQVIKESVNISFEDKNSLLIGLSVAKSSFRLWKKKMNV